MTKARTLADFNTTNINPANLDATGTIPSALLAGVGGGKVLQVVQVTDSTTRTNVQASDVGNNGAYSKNGTSLVANITPSSTTSKILIIASSTIYKRTSGEMYLSLFKDTTNLGNSKGFGYFNALKVLPWSKSHLDSPNTTSQLEYSVQFKSVNTTEAVLNYDGNEGRLILMEIAA